MNTHNEKKNKRNNINTNLDLKKLVLLSIAMGISFVLIFLIISIRQTGYDLQGIISVLPDIAKFFWIATVIFIVFAITGFCLFKAISLRTVKLASYHFSNRFKQNEAYEFSRIFQEILFEALRRNNDVFNLHLTNDIRSIELKSVAIKDNVLHFQYDIISLDRPLYRNKYHLAKILQGFIYQELSYGIRNWNPYYKGICSVFVDRIFYDRVNNTFTVNLVLIDCPEAVNYYNHALQRDKKYIKDKKTINRLLSKLGDR